MYQFSQKGQNDTMFALFLAFIPYHFIQKMPFSKEREKRLEYGYGEVSDIVVLDLNVKDEVVLDSEYLSDQPKNEYNIQNKEVIKKLKCIKLRHNAFTECLYYVSKLKKNMVK